MNNHTLFMIVFSLNTLYTEVSDQCHDSVALSPDE